MNIRNSLYAFGAVLAAALVLATAVGLLSANRVRIGGDMYGQISQGKDLVADILPPPAYVIEAYLEATLALNRAKPVADSVARLKQLHADYDERHAFWQNAELDASIKQKLTVKSHEKVAQFWSALERDFLPALERNDGAAAANAYSQITSAYAAHRNVINDIVEDADKLNKSIEVAASRQSTIALWSVVGVLLLVFGALGYGILLMARRVVTPVVRMTAVMKALACGDLETSVPFADRNDEVGEMAKSLLIFRDAGLQKIELEQQAEAQRREADGRRLQDAAAQAKASEERAASAREQARVVDALAQALKQLASGNLEFRMRDQFPDAYEQIKIDFNAAVETLSETILVISQAAAEIGHATAEIAAGTTDLSARTERQSQGLEETAASMEQIAATVKKTADNVRRADEYAGNSGKFADAGGEVVAKAIQSMARIEDSSRRITEIIVVIDELARQTNLLALNAAVEAARAGDAGRGFAVVASEVRNLAQRSSQAAKDIKELIGSSSEHVREGVSLVNRTGESLTAIVGSIKQMAGIVSDISAASSEQATAANQVNAALGQLDEATQQNSALVEQSAAAAKALEQQTQAMQSRIDFFQLADRVQTHGSDRAVHRAA